MVGKGLKYCLGNHSGKYRPKMLFGNLKPFRKNRNLGIIKQFMQFVEKIKGNVNQALLSFWNIGLIHLYTLVMFISWMFQLMQQCAPGILNSCIFVPWKKVIKHSSYSSKFHWCNWTSWIFHPAFYIPVFKLLPSLPYLEPLSACFFRFCCLVLVRPAKHTIT